MAAQPPPGPNPYGTPQPGYGNPAPWGGAPAAAQPAVYGAPPAVPGIAAQVATASSAERDGIGLAKIGAIMGVVSQGLFWIGVALFDIIFSSLGTGVVPGWVTPTTAEAVLAMWAVGPVVGVISYLLYYLGFRKIKSAAPDFGSPTVLLLIGLIGFAMLAGGIGLIVGGIISAISSLASGSTGVGFGLGAILTGLALIGFGAILSFIGVIGMVLGNYRAGGRYQESMLRIGGILTIIPFVSIVGFLLCFIGFHNAGKKLASGWQPPTTVTVVQATMVPMAVPYAAQGMPYAAYGAPQAASPYPMAAPQPQPQPMYQQPPQAQTPAYPAQQSYAAATQTAPYGTAPAPAAAPAAAPVASGGAPACKSCGKPTTFVPQYSRYYCYGCAQYA